MPTSRAKMFVAHQQEFAVIVFLVLAAVGLALSVLAHFSTFFGVDPQQLFPAIWVLHIGIFVVWIPTVMLQRSVSSSAGGYVRKPRSWNEMMPYAPQWLARLLPLLFGYCVINFIVFIVHTSGGSPHVNGKGGYELRDHGRVVRTLTAAEYHSYRGWEVRGFYGHWMIFYGAALAVLLSAFRERQIREGPDEAFVDGTATRIAPPPAVAPVLNYGRSLPAWAMPIWLHATLSMMLLMAGWLAGPALVAFFVLPHMHNGANKVNPGLICPTIILLFGSALFGALVPRALLRRLVPSRCPSCGGRAYYAANDPVRYRCRDCGREHEVRP